MRKHKMAIAATTASVTTSTGVTFNVVKARRKNRRAASASRRAETRTR